MNRLTIKIPECGRYTLGRLCSFSRDGEIYDIKGCQDYCYEIGEDCDYCALQRAFNRLAAYEDTGLTPEEIELLKSENARLHKLVDNICV